MMWARKKQTPTTFLKSSTSKPGTRRSATETGDGGGVVALSPKKWESEKPWERVFKRDGKGIDRTHIPRINRVEGEIGESDQGEMFVCKKKKELNSMHVKGKTY